MGATGFDVVVRGNKTMNEAYNEAVEEARAEHGYDAYSGTIATTNGVVRASDTPMTMAQAVKFMDDYYDGTRQVSGVEKWEAAGAIPLLASTGETETRSKKVTLDTVEYASYQRGNRDVITSELRILKGYELVSFRVTNTDTSVKVETKATDGERETRYFIEGDGFGPYRWDNGFESQAAARAHLDAFAAKDDLITSGANRSWGIYAVTRRADGSPLVRTKRLVKRAVLAVEYTMEKRPTRAKPDGWLLFGWAAC